MLYCENSVISKYFGGFMSKRRRKNKVAHLTEKDYGNYIMSLKDEKPVEAIPKKTDRFDGTGP